MLFSSNQDDLFFLFIFRFSKTMINIFEIDTCCSTFYFILPKNSVVLLLFINILFLINSKICLCFFFDNFVVAFVARKLLQCTNKKKLRAYKQKIMGMIQKKTKKESSALNCLNLKDFYFGKQILDLFYQWKTC